MRRGVLWWVILLNVLALVALIFVYPQFMLSPGALTAGHAKLDSDCFACHVAWRGARTEKCVDCHRPADIGLHTTAGARGSPGSRRVAFHQQLTTVDCLVCHTDHAGRRGEAAARKPFAHDMIRAGVRDRCETCHQAPRDSLHSSLRGGCAQCHGTDHWKPAAFDHAQYFELDRAHSVACDTCHVGGNFRQYTCYGCHEHSPARVQAQHRGEVRGNLDQCVRCHRGPHDGGESGGDD
jgi:hypothetical protein